MNVNQKKQIAKCFSCGVGGNAISFIQKYENIINHNSISVNEALVKTVEICNLDIDVSQINKKNYNRQYVTSSRTYTDDEKEMLQLNERLNQLFSYNLTVIRGESFDYLHNREISDTLIKKLSMGFAPKGQLLKASKNNEKFPVSLLKKLGYLKINNDGSLYETFQDRIIIPIHDEKGNIVSFCGRTIRGEKPKYLHTIETDIFHKKELLYNFHHSKALAYNNELILVEGYMDVVGAKKLGFENVTALMGISISEEQLKLIKNNHSSIILALDNDEPGRRAMLDHIPRLLEKDLKVDVIDISKLGDYKDFGDLGNTNLQYMDIQKYKISGFSYLLANKYFVDKELNVENISLVYKLLRKDKLIKNTYDESLYKEYLLKNSSFSKSELDEIMYPKKIEKKTNVIDNFTSIAMANFLFLEIKNQVDKTNDKVLISYFENNKSIIQSKLVEIYNKNPDFYLDSDSSVLKVELLLSNFLKDNKEYTDYESLNRFKYIGVFDKTYIKNSSGSARVKLNDNQVQLVIKQYEDTLNDKDKLSLEEVEELYIINSIDDIDGILSYNNNTLDILKDNIKDRMIINNGKMDFFKFGNLFLNIDKDFIDNKFKGKTGNYKTILFYNNLDNSLLLDKSNVVIENNKEEIQSISKESTIEQKKEISKDFLFSINQVLLVPELETDSHYFVRIPSTGAKEYFYVNKNDCEWNDNGEIFYTKLEQNKSYSIYNRDGEFLHEKSFNELKHNWEDKTKSNNKDDYIDRSEIKNELSENKENKILFDNSYVSRYKEPICKVYKSKIYLETEKGFYIKTDDSKVLLFAVKKICNWNEDKSYLIISPRRGKLMNSGLSKYLLEGYKKEFQKKLFYNELEKYIKVFYPSISKKKDLITFEISKNKCEFTSNFIKIPLVIDDVNGYIQVSLMKSKINEESVILEFSKDEQIVFRDKQGNYINHFDSSKVSESYNEMLSNNKVIQFPSTKELEKEAA